MERQERIRRALQDALKPDTEGDTLEALADLEVLEEFTADYAQARVDDARAAGASWSQIADRLGVSRQAAHKRFGSKKPRKTSLELRLVWDRKKT